MLEYGFNFYRYGKKIIVIRKSCIKINQCIFKSIKFQHASREGSANTTNLPLPLPHFHLI